ncbi:MAG: histidine phosphatase family protein [bacterium]|nr:histidine phosphatase family protein [bacterium]MDZ4247700.1 histidine phosphatase family protein [Patescibacteria group bacterium]
MTKLPPPISLQNRYYGFRHGQSEANVLNKIISDPKVGTKRFGLSDAGRKQVIESVRANRAVLERAVLYSSDFLRAKETAEVIAETIKSGPRSSESIHFDRRLRERFFGDFDGGDHEAYVRVWSADRQSAKDSKNGVEPVIHVAERVSALVRELEKEMTGRDIVLVAHGDPLQITETWMQGDELENHRAHQFDTAEVRPLNPAGGNDV